MAAAMPDSIWKLHDKIANIRNLAIKLCGRLEQRSVKPSELEIRAERLSYPEFDDRSTLEVLKDVWWEVNGETDPNVWFLLGEASGHIGNLLTVSLHYQVIAWCQSLLSMIRDPDLLIWRTGEECFTDEQQESLERAAHEELAEIASGHRRQLESIAFNKLFAEAKAASLPKDVRDRDRQSGCETGSTTVGMTVPADPRSNLVIEFHEGTSQSATITWNGMRHPVDDGTAGAFQAMLDAEGLPLGLGTGGYVTKPSRWFENLKRDHPELAAIVEPKGNKGFRLTIFNRPSDRV